MPLSQRKEHAGTFQMLLASGTSDAYTRGEPRPDPRVVDQRVWAGRHRRPAGRHCRPAYGRAGVVVDPRADILDVRVWAGRRCRPAGRHCRPVGLGGSTLSTRGYGRRHRHRGRQRGGEVYTFGSRCIHLPLSSCMRSPLMPHGHSLIPMVPFCMKYNQIACLSMASIDRPSASVRPRGGGRCLHSGPDVYTSLAAKQ